MAFSVYCNNLSLNRKNFLYLNKSLSLYLLALLESFSFFFSSIFNSLSIATISISNFFFRLESSVSSNVEKIDATPETCVARFCNLDKSLYATPIGLIELLSFL